uniref:Uncharacterized protein n=1 Tax=Lepeophtheirus salmonis TaxID=72036 RepID=A0A0K2TIP8_LEPSM
MKRIILILWQLFPTCTEPYSIFNIWRYLKYYFNQILYFLLLLTTLNRGYVIPFVYWYVYLKDYGKSSKSTLIQLCKQIINVISKR